MLVDDGFKSKYDGLCVVCLRPFDTGDLLATAPREYHRITHKGGTMRFGHLACVNAARDGAPASAPIGGVR